MLLLSWNEAAGSEDLLTTSSDVSKELFSNDKNEKLGGPIENGRVCATKLIQLPVSFLTAAIIWMTAEDIVAFGQNVMAAVAIDAYKFAGSVDMIDSSPLHCMWRKDDPSTRSINKNETCMSTLMGL